MSARLSNLFSPGSAASQGLLAVALVSVLIASVLDLGGTPVVSVNDKLQHILVFAVLCGMVRRALPSRDRWRVVLPLMLGYGLLIECVQWYVPWREFSLVDLLADLFGVLLAFAVEGTLGAYNRQLPP